MRTFKDGELHGFALFFYSLRFSKGYECFTLANSPLFSSAMSDWAWDANRGVYYHIPPDRKPFQTCLTECSDLGMSLAAPRNQAELTFLMDNFLNNWTDYEKKVWIGLDDLQQEGIDWEAL